MVKKLLSSINLKKLQNLALTKNLVWFLFFALFSNIALSQTISPWKMNRGAGVINATNTLPSHGDPAAYTQMDIPGASDANWENAPVNANGEINFSETSIIPNISGNCLNKLDFTYFETYISIPANYNLTSLIVDFTAADDGA